MPVTFALAGHQATDWTKAKTKSSDALFAASCSRDSNESQKLIQSSVSRRDFRKRHISPSSNGLIWAVFYAYSKHHHLVLRPEDIWFAILCQLSFFINANAEELRDYFVSHQGRKELVVEDVGSMEHADFGVLACRMTDLIQDNVKEPRLREWIMPSFSTTTDCDRTVAAILMMGSMQKYFSFMMRSCCGIPSVTLLGEQKDWENILYRLEYLSELGTEPDTFANLLKPILRGFVASFDAQRSQANTEFWDKMVHRNSMMSGQDYFSGWITAFGYWSEDGKASYIRTAMPDRRDEVDEREYGCVLEDVRYPCIDTDSVPAGFASVPVTVDNNGEIWNTKMVAGSIGIEAKRSDGQAIDEAIYHNVEESGPVERESRSRRRREYAGLNTVQPLTGWFMHDVGTSA